MSEATNGRRVNGPTPNGGAYSIAYYFNDAGDPVSPAEATRGEIIEYDSADQIVFRTHLAPRQPEAPPPMWYEQPPGVFGS